MIFKQKFKAIKKSSPATAKKPSTTALNTSKSFASTNLVASSIPKPKPVTDARNPKVDATKKFTIRRPSKTALGVKTETKPKEPQPVKPQSARPSKCNLSCRFQRFLLFILSSSFNCEFGKVFIS